jgi:hypothetical protein
MSQELTNVRLLKIRAALSILAENNRGDVKPRGI